MNYLREINAFVDWLETNPLDAMTQALWFHLMAINNKCNWLEWFAVANLTLQAKLGVDKKTIIKHRNILIQKQLIDYKNQGRAAGKYKILSISGNIGGNIPLKEELINDISGNNPPTRPPDLPPKCPPNRPPLVKLNETKLNRENIYSIFNHWNSKSIITHRKLTDKMRGHINAKLDNYSVDEIIQAIDNYYQVLRGDEFFFSYRWKLDEFLIRGFEKFLTENDPFSNYRSDKSVRKEDKQLGKPAGDDKKKMIQSLYMS